MYDREGVRAMTQQNEQARNEMAPGRQTAPLPVSPVGAAGQGAAGTPDGPAAPGAAAWRPGVMTQPGNPFAIAGMVLGICSIVFCWWGLLTLAMVILAITFGGIGIHRANQGAEKKGMAMAGVACGAFGGFLYLIVGIVSLGVGFLL